MCVGVSTYAASAMACRFDVGCGKNKAIFNASHSVNRFAPDGNRSIFKFILKLNFFFFRLSISLSFRVLSLRLLLRLLRFLRFFDFSDD